MSVQFGICNFDGRPMDPEDLAKVRPVLAQCGPDGEGYICKDNLAVLYRAFHTTNESRREVQPHVTASGAVLTWDGRLDNREELIDLLADKTSASSGDLDIVAAAYERWGTDSFAKLVGDWAISIWDAEDRSLILAKDPIGARHLYYSVEKEQVTWCTVLDPLVLFAGHSFEIEEEYVAGWLSFFPAPHLTPYVGICSVPPSSFVRLSKGIAKSTRYWDFDPAKRVLYGSDDQYEEHFRTVFFESVRRRLRSDCPVLAELSGGMDSASIVCAADKIIAANPADFPRLDTLSYYNDLEPSWNERPYFSKVEERRGRIGCHIDISEDESSGFGVECDKIPLTPGSLTNSFATQRLFLQCIVAQGNRVVLSGMGGDEVTGGVPSPSTELADLLTEGEFGQLAGQLKVWALCKRRPWLHLLFEMLRRFLPPTLFGFPAQLQAAAWISREFKKRHRYVLSGYENRLKLFRSHPSFQGSLSNLDAIRRQLACFIESPGYPYEKRYPFLDRNLLEFLFSVPRSQLLRPGERRSLMRRALVNVLPDEIRMRRRKGYMSRQPLKVLNSALRSQQGPGAFSACSNSGWFDMERLLNCLNAAKRGEQIPLVLLSRTIGLELWMQRTQCSASSPNARAVTTFPFVGQPAPGAYKQDSALAG